jgi:hypothetical protein
VQTNARRGKTITIRRPKILKIEYVKITKKLLNINKNIKITK